MKKYLVAYFSRTGNTRAVAEAVHEALEQPKALLPLEKAADLEGYKVVFIGFPVQSHSVPFAVETFLKKIPAGRKIALFSTHGSLPGDRLSREAVEHAVILAGRARVLGTFTCRGKVSLQALEVLKRSPEHEAWADMAASASTHPDASDLEDARAFSRWIATLAAQDHP
ncbi:MAG: hypothetical protein FJY83_12105 [Candidatus Aminicenantes bacterium]|nr:hypothetical protein [Candidatus Aminicenantes bacterium]